MHLPFCKQKCNYCDFLSFQCSKERRSEYLSALKWELDGYQEMKQTHMLTSIFIGGGTPSVLSVCEIKQVFSWIKQGFLIEEGAEITIEVNPGTVDRQKLEEYKSLGVNRISLGLQSTNDSELKTLGRIHTYEEFLETYVLAREVGFDNINIDLMSSIPHQTLESWEETLDKIIQLQPEHISAYSLIIEEGTPFYQKYDEVEAFLPDEEEERIIYYRTKEKLMSAGYHRYEISNYAKEGKECRHNIGYWERRDYLGVGLGAASLLDNVRITNVKNFDSYIQNPNFEREREELSAKSQMEEFVFLGLRKMQGIDRREFLRCFQTSIEVAFQEQIQEMVQKNLLVWEEDYLRLTERGIDVSNFVMSAFL